MKMKTSLTSVITLTFSLCAGLTLATPAARGDATTGKLKIQRVDTRAHTPARSSGGSSDTAGNESGAWKGEPEPSHFSIGALGGLGLINSTGGFSLIPTASMKVADHGWLNDVNDAVSLEAEFGPLFSVGATVLYYSAQLRWDFQYDKNWILYAIGGVGGFSAPESFGGFEIFPRFGIGAMYDFHIPVIFRFELSHELIALGVNVPLF